MNLLLTKIKAAFQFFLPEIRKSNYQGYTVFHHKKDSLFGEIRKAGVGLYEPTETACLLDLIHDVSNPIVLDIGANIGLISLNLFRKKSDITIFAFEPGPKQFNLLHKNIAANNLSSRIFAQNIALGSSKGKGSFFTHSIEHTSGDGFLDTERAGAVTAVEVEINSLDQWWNEKGFPKITMMKLDTEGSELVILEHSRKLIQSCKPKLAIEICYLNYEKYGFTFAQHIDFFESIGYDLYDYETKEIMKVSEIDFRPAQFNYYALPK